MNPIPLPGLPPSPGWPVRAAEYLAALRSLPAKSGRILGQPQAR